MKVVSREIRRIHKLHYASSLSASIQGKHKNATTAGAAEAFRIHKSGRHDDICCLVSLDSIFKGFPTPAALDTWGFAPISQIVRQIQFPSK